MTNDELKAALALEDAEVETARYEHGILSVAYTSTVNGQAYAYDEDFDVATANNTLENAIIIVRRNAAESFRNRKFK